LQEEFLPKVDSKEELNIHFEKDLPVQPQKISERTRQMCRFISFVCIFLLIFVYFIIPLLPIILFFIILVCLVVHYVDILASKVENLWSSLCSLLQQGENLQSLMSSFSSLFFHVEPDSVAEIVIGGMAAIFSKLSQCRSRNPKKHKVSRWASLILKLRQGKGINLQDLTHYILKIFFLYFHMITKMILFSCDKK